MVSFTNITTTAIPALNDSQPANNIETYKTFVLLNVTESAIVTEITELIPITTLPVASDSRKGSNITISTIESTNHGIMSIPKSSQGIEHVYTTTHQTKVLTTEEDYTIKSSTSIMDFNLTTSTFAAFEPSETYVPTFSSSMFEGISTSNSISYKTTISSYHSVGISEIYSSQYTNSSFYEQISSSNPFFVNSTLSASNSTLSDIYTPASTSLIVPTTSPYQTQTSSTLSQNTMASLSSVISTEESSTVAETATRGIDDTMTYSLFTSTIEGQVTIITTFCPIFTLPTATISDIEIISTSKSTPTHSIDVEAGTKTNLVPISTHATDRTAVTSKKEVTSTILPMISQYNSILGQSSITTSHISNSNTIPTLAIYQDDASNIGINTIAFIIWVFAILF